MRKNVELFSNYARSISVVAGMGMVGGIGFLMSSCTQLPEVEFSSAHRPKPEPAITLISIDDGYNGPHPERHGLLECVGDNCPSPRVIILPVPTLSP